MESVAIVTGASQGIGQATALRLARDFSGGVLVARSREHLDETAEQVKATGAKPLVPDLDLSEPMAADTVVRRREHHFATMCGVEPSKRDRK
jgi:short-subunit dehydrogenase